MNRGWFGTFICLPFFIAISAQSVLAVDATIEALWQKNAPNGPTVCSLSGKVAGAVEFRPILTFGENEFGEVYRILIREVAGHDDPHYDGNAWEAPRTEGDG